MQSNIHEHVGLVGEWSARLRLPVSPEAVALSLFHLSHLLRAGVGLNEALHEVQLLEQGRRMRSLWGGIAEGVRCGDSLSQVMAVWPGAFDESIIALIKAGEANGELEQACASCCEVLEWRVSTRSRLFTALLYPAFALLVLTAVLIFLFVSVVPSLEAFLSASQGTLAWHSRALLHVSDWLTKAWLPTSAGLVLLVLLIVALRQSLSAFRLLSDRCVLRLPVIGTLLVQLSLSRYASICGRLYRSGVELSHALQLSEGVLRNSALKQSFSRIRTALIAGSTLSESMDGSPHLPASFRRILAAGESAGALDQALSQAGDQHYRLARLQLDRLERLVGPLTLTVVGGNLLWVIISVMGPVYESAIEAVLLS
ncbi:type II secretion system F family protein [Granulosicoccus sp. 3-233]|uniref:type II secretion system F family protein n=1 Tax=Granulosicoccus sp. 3-233 TaxID=3417969 RepID=UPI003D3433AF